MKYGVGENDLLLCYFGFLSDSKGGIDLVRALALVPNARLLMVGGQVGASDETNAAYLAQVKNLVAELNLSARVIWTGYTEAAQVSANLLAADICVLPYRDGASFRRGSLMAALAHGLAIVTTTPASNGEGAKIRDGENALLVPPQDPPALAEAINRLANDGALRARIALGAKRLSELFTWDKIAAQHLNLYERILKPLRVDLP
jgi:glycosyltransferase involved in cell wall biosynthesis